MTEGDAGAAPHEAQEHLRLLRRQIYRLPLAYTVFDLVVVWLLVREGWSGAAFGWLIVYCALQLVRWRWARRAGRESGADAERVLQRLGAMTVLLGALRVVPVVLLFARPAPQSQALLTLIYIGLSAAAVVTAGGRWRIFAAWASFACGSLALAWLLQGTLQGGIAAAVIVVLALTLATYVNDQQRTLATLAGLVHDNERLAASLRAERDHVAAASQAQTRFFAAASHDLRQPLHALTMNAMALDLLARSNPEPRLRALSSGIRRSLEQSQALLDDLLDIARLDAHAVQPEWQSVDVAAMLGSVRDDHAALAAAEGLALRLEIDPACAPRARADPALLRRILDNLLSNAVKYTAAGSVTLSAVPAEDGAIRLAVADTGQGIAAQDQARVFEEFVQGDPAAHGGRDRGLGLGLAIVRRIAALLGAPLALRSTLGEGTEVALVLRAAPSQTDTSAVT